MSVSASPDRLQIELLACAEDPGYFLDRYARIYDATAADWVPFTLWPKQIETLDTIHANRLAVILKARQLGLTWLVLGYALWQMIFRPKATVLLFSRRDDEAVDLLKTRLRGMYDRLPHWLKVSAFVVDNDHEWELSNGSRALAFPTTAGDSYTATLAIVDEADLVPDLDRLMRAVKPTIDGGGGMILLSRADKARPQSPFKKIYQAACRGLTDWQPVFLPWHAHPGRDAAWYAAQKADVMARTGSDDDLYEQYPATDAEALAARSLDKRLPFNWLKNCYQPREPLTGPYPPMHKPPAVNGLALYAVPQPGRRYVIGADPAEGNPTSDPSALEVVDEATGEEVAALAGRFEPATFAAHVDTVGRYFNHAAVLVERNNHGHAVLLWLRDNSPLPLLYGDDGRPGWNTTVRSKALLYDGAGQAFRDGNAVLHSADTFMELASIEGMSQRAPEGETDDRAVAFVLAQRGRLLRAACAEEDLGSLMEPCWPGRSDPFGPQIPGGW